MSKPLAPTIADLLQRHSFADRLDDEIYLVRCMLLKKNAAYGNSALDPVRIFSSAPPAEQIAVRLDDKLSRLKRGHAAGEDVEEDLLGYLFLRRIARRLEADALEEAPRSVSDKKEPAPGAEAAAGTASQAPPVETNVSPRPAAPAQDPVDVELISACAHRYVKTHRGLDGLQRRCVLCGATKG
ncbi:protein of unknown function [Hyphomicrobium sp. 1Nfss2.1]|uniref:hypothetical protein n=1 Tax=Hyphomicrobium sp. 1Nfss2.1 TaxID=3413936 RepID=UPI003C7A6EA4